MAKINYLIEIFQYNPLIMQNKKPSGTIANSVAFAAISNDDKKLLSISNDGVIIVRNLEY